MIFPKASFAKGEFLTSYDVGYDVSADGVTDVTEKVTFKNQTERYFASSFTLTIGATQISNVSAFDSGGPLSVETRKSGTKTEITVKFSQQVVGTGKEYPWTLKFSSADFAQKTGKVWQISIPKIASLEDLDKYNLELSIPVDFGDPASISPEPVKQSEGSGNVHYFFSKNQLTDSGIMANFGKEQLFDFVLKFDLENKGLVPALAKVPLPSQTQYQDVIISSINPKPENVTEDVDGNFIGWFKVGKRQKVAIEVQGSAKLYLDRQKKAGLTEEDRLRYLKHQKYWEKDSPQIKAKLSEIFEGQDTGRLTNPQKAQMISRFVSSFLRYDEKRLKERSYQRLGALTVLGNPDKALCQEFADLFIALVRAAGVPARGLIGYAYTPNQELRPLSFEDNLLHAWPEYWDPDRGWVMVDPTWENTTGGVDYFSKFDLNHLVMVTRGESSEDPVPANFADVKFSEAEFIPQSAVILKLIAPDEILSGFPVKAKLRVESTGNSLHPGAKIEISSGKIGISDNRVLEVGPLPPFGFFEHEFSLRSKDLWGSFDDVLQLKADEQTVTKKIVVKPFFAYKLFPLAIFGVIGFMMIIYGTILFIHLRFAPKKAR